MSGEPKAGVAPTPKAPTPEQRAYRKEVAERNARLQERGVPFPKATSGIFGGKPSAAK